MRNVRLLVLAVVVAILGGFFTAHLTASTAGAATQPAVLKVRHRAGNGSDVAVTEGYTVQYKRYDLQINPPVGGWETDYTTLPSDAGVEDGNCATGTYRWKYQVDLDDTRYTAIEWKVTIEVGRSGTTCSGTSVTYQDSSSLVQQTYPGGTATMNAMGYE